MTRNKLSKNLKELENVYVVVQFYPWCNLFFLRLKLIIINYHSQKQRKNKFAPRIKLHHNIYMSGTKRGSMQFSACNLKTKNTMNELNFTF